MADTHREMILVAAEAYLREVGPVGFEVKELATRADFNASLVNYHFGGKETLILEVATRVFARNARALIERVERHSNPLDGLAEFVDVMIEHTIDYGAMAPLIGFQDAFGPRIEPRIRQAMSDETLEDAEEIGVVLFSVLYALHRRRPYRRLNKLKMGAVAVTNPAVMDAVSVVGFSVAGFPQVWSQYQAKPIFGFDPSKRMKAALMRLGARLGKVEAPDVEDAGVYES